MKTCVHCREEKRLTDFHMDRSKPDGLNSTCKPCRTEICRRSVDNTDQTQRKKNKKIWASDNLERARNATAKWRAAHPKENSEVYKRWAAKNRDKINATKRMRLAQKKAVTPAWADKERIKEFYRYAILMTQLSGVLHEVDHAIPINGKTASGLHCESNLQVITSSENLKKSNRWWPDMW